MPKKSNTTVIFKKVSGSGSGSGSSGFTPDGVVGSTRAGQFLRDAVKGIDSVDIITIGDSNAGFQSAGVPAGSSYSYGWTCGLHRALGSFLGIAQYATALIPTALESTDANGIDRGDTIVGINVLGTSVKCNWPGTAQAGEGAAAGPVSRLENRVDNSDANAIALKSNLGYSTATDNPDVGFGKLLPRFTGFLWDGAFVASGNTYTSAGNKNFVYLKTTSPILTTQSQPSLQYRCVYGKFAGGSGTFRATGLILTGFVATQGTTTPTSGGSAGNWYGTSTVTFNGPTVTNGVASSDVCASWDNINQGSPVVGPFCGLWHSIARLNAKGYSVNNYIYQGGAQSIHLLNRLNTNADILDSYLKEIRERQVATSGSGRAIVWLNVGINGPESQAAWTANMTAVINKLVERWTAVGNNPNNLAFIISASHPAPAVSTWATARPNTVAASNTVATNLASSGVVAVDIAEYYSSAELLSANVLGTTLYDAAGQAHLRGFHDYANGYDAVATSMIAAVCSYV